MSGPQVKPAQVELRCVKNSDGTYNGGSYLDGKQLLPAADYGFHRGTCDDVKRVHDKLQREYAGANIQVV